MPTEISMNQRQRGKTLTLSFTIVNRKGDYVPSFTEVIKVNDLAFVQFKFHHVLGAGLYFLNKSIKFKTVKTDDSQIKLKLTTNYGTSRDKEWICGDEWAESELCSRPPNFKVNDLVSRLEVSITVQKAKHRCLQSTKLYDDTELTDFHLSSADGNVKIHKALLAMHSEVFMMMLKREWKETLTGEIAIKGVTKQTLQGLKQYIYLGTLPDEGLEQLLVIAAHYMMDELEADCITKLVQSVTPEKLDDLVEFACLNNLPALMKAILTETSDTIVNDLCKLSKGEAKDENN